MYNRMCKSLPIGSKSENCIGFEVRACGSDVNYNSDEDFGGAFTCSTYHAPTIFKKEDIPSMLSLLEGMLPQAIIHEYKSNENCNVRELTVGKSEPGLGNRNRIPLTKKNPCQECNQMNTITVGLTDDCGPCQRKKFWSRRKCLLEDESSTQFKACRDFTKSKLSLKAMFDIDYAPCRAYDDASPCLETNVDFVDNFDCETILSARSKERDGQCCNQSNTMFPCESNSTKQNVELDMCSNDMNTEKKCGSCSKKTKKHFNASSQCEVDERKPNTNKASCRICTDCQNSNKLSSSLEFSKPCSFNIVKEILQCKNNGIQTQAQTIETCEKESIAYFYSPRTTACIFSENTKIHISSTSINSHYEINPETINAYTMRNQIIHENNSNISIKSGSPNKNSEQVLNTKTTKVSEQNCKVFLESNNLDTLNYGKTDISSQQYLQLTRTHDSTNSIKMQKNEETDTYNEEEIEIQTSQDIIQNKYSRNNGNRSTSKEIISNKVEITAEKSSGSLKISLDVSTSIDFENDIKGTCNAKSILRSNETCRGKNLKSDIENQPNELNDSFKCPHINDISNKGANNTNCNYNYSNNCGRNGNFMCPKYNSRLNGPEEIFLHQNKNYRQVSCGNICNSGVNCDNKGINFNYSNNYRRNSNSNQYYKSTSPNIPNAVLRYNTNYVERISPKYIIKKTPRCIDQMYSQQKECLSNNIPQCEFYSHANNISNLASMYDHQRDEHNDVSGNVDFHMENYPVLITQKVSKNTQNKLNCGQNTHFIQTNNDSKKPTYNSDKETQILNKKFDNNRGNTGIYRGELNQNLPKSFMSDNVGKSSMYPNKSARKPFQNNDNCSNIYETRNNCSQFPDNSKNPQHINRNLQNQRNCFIFEDYSHQQQGNDFRENQSFSDDSNNYERIGVENPYISGRSSPLNDNNCDKELVNIKYLISEENVPNEEVELFEARYSDAVKIDSLIGNILRPRSNSCASSSNNIDNYRDYCTYQECRGQPIYNVNQVYHTSREWRGQPTGNMNNHPVYHTGIQDINGFNGAQTANTQVWRKQPRTEPIRNMNILKTTQKEYQFPNGRKVLKTEITTEIDDTGRQMGYGNFSAFDTNRSISRNKRNNFDSRNFCEIPSTSCNQSNYGFNSTLPLSAYSNYNSRNCNYNDILSNQQHSSRDNGKRRWKEERK